MNIITFEGKTVVVVEKIEMINLCDKEITIYFAVRSTSVSFDTNEKAVEHFESLRKLLKDS